MGQENVNCLKDTKKQLHRYPIPTQVIKYQDIILHPKFQTPNPYCPQLYGESDHQLSSEIAKPIKKPLNNKQRTQYVWGQASRWTYSVKAVKQLSNQVIKKRTFEEKSIWLREKLEKQKQSTKKGYNKIIVDPTNVLLSSYKNFNEVNFNIETRIVFNDDKGAIDAGGLFREWMQLCIKQAFSPDLAMFKLCETDQTAYKIVCNDQNKNLFTKFAKILGFVIGKSILQRTPINCYLNRTLFRIISGNPIQINDVYSYDKQLYQSWKSILDEPISEQDLISFTTSIYDPFLQKENIVQLKKNGSQEFVNDDNKQEFIKKSIKYHCYDSIESIVTALRNSLYQIIPYQYLGIFEPHELQMLICGRQIIDVEDWKNNTNYKDYTKDDKQIKWFWEVVQSFSQEFRSNLVHFTTGSSKIPIQGFSKLECKRGKEKKFYIKKVQVDPNNPFPKGITCFNRLELPQYKSFEQMASMLHAVAQQQIHDFGLDDVKH